MVEWDGTSRVEVFLKAAYKNNVCGLCGNMNSNPEDDWKVGPACHSHEDYNKIVGK